MNNHKIYKANDIPPAQPVTGQYSEDAIRVGVLRDMIEARDAEIERLNEQLRELDDLACFLGDIDHKHIVKLFESNKALKAENERLNRCIKALEREALKEPRGFEMTEREFLRQRSLEDQHNSCEASWNGRLDNTTGNFAHLD